MPLHLPTVLTEIRSLLDEPGKLQRLARGALPVKSIEENRDEWVGLYEGLLARTGRGAALA